MDLDLILVPYDSARRGERMGAGPDALVDAGLEAHLARRGHAVRRTVVEPPAGSWRAEVRTAFDLAAGVAAAVRSAKEGGRFPVVLAGNCGVSLGVVAALGAGAGVVWCDAHGDFNTPETTVGGFLDGMMLATLTGRCWTALAARTVPGFAPVPESRVWLLGARDLDPAEADALDRSAIRRAPASDVGVALAERVARDLGGPAVPLYLHLDLDVLDPSEGRANGFAAPGGVSAAALADFCRALAQRATPAAVTLSAYDPSSDPERRVYRAAIAVLDALLDAGADVAARG